MQELGGITKEQALALLGEVQGTVVKASKGGGYWEKADIITLINAADKWEEWSGVGHSLSIRSGGTWYRWDLL